MCVIFLATECTERSYSSLRSSAHSAVNIEMIPAPIGSFNNPVAPASTLYPATAARQGGSVAVSLVDSCEFRTADKRG